MKTVLINNKWPLTLPDHRAAFSKWDRWEYRRLAAMREVIKPGDVVMDVGAEAGEWPGLWASWGARVIPFEPNPRFWPNIKEIWELNDLEPPPAHFVGFASNKTILRPPEIESLIDQPQIGDWPACAYGDTTTEHNFRNVSERYHDTPQIKIDDFCMLHAIYPDVITIDVEGAELLVLVGARRVLKDIRPVVFLSLHSKFMIEMYGHEPGRLFRFMKKLGYRAEFLWHDHESHWRLVPE